MRRTKAFNISLTVLLSIGFVVVGVVYFSSSYLRLVETLKDLWASIEYMFTRMLGREANAPTINEYSKVLQWEILLPEDFEVFKVSATEYFTLLFSKENLQGYGIVVAKTLLKIAKFLTAALPFVLVIWLVLKIFYQSNNTKHNKDTAPLKAFKWVDKKVFYPIKKAVLGYVEYLKEHRWIVILWIVLWVIQLNLASIVIAAIGYFLYFAVTFKVDTIYIQVCKLCIDLQVVFKAVPIWVLVLVGYMFFCRFRKRIALAKLQRFEARNCGLITDLPIVSMTCGSMGKKKTTIITDMALSQAVMFRQKALELLQKNDMRFPFFPWISFELDLRRCMEYGTVYNLATAKEWVKKKRDRFVKSQDRNKIYGYDVERYGLSYDDGLREYTLWDVLTTYAQLYFIYIIQSSLIVSNYSIREESEIVDMGNFPLWSTSFFRDGIDGEDRYAHILDFDVLRLGKKVLENNPNSGSFEFGVVVISEVGKERGNNLELREVKKTKEETNQKNDLFNSWLKMCRHSATVDNFPFVKVFTDEQRPASWGADARDLADILNIASSGRQRLALPFYTIEEMLAEFALDKFMQLYYDFRHRRGDNTLLVHILKGITAWLYQRNVAVHNKYGYCIVQIEKEKGTLDGKVEKKKYFVMNKKIYSRRFSTDCFSDYFNEIAKRTKVGLKDYIAYATEKATADELKMQNSYFINALYKDAGSNQ